MSVNTQQYSPLILAQSAAGNSPLYIGVKTTGIFCRPGCPAKPKPINRLVYKTAKQALTAGFRPCKRCKPLSHPLFTSPALGIIILAVESEPHKNWTAARLASLSAGLEQANSEFKRRFGMSLAEYAELRRRKL